MGTYEELERPFGGERVFLQPCEVLVALELAYSGEDVHQGGDECLRRDQPGEIGQQLALKDGL